MELLANAETRIASTFCVVENAVMAALALSGLPWVSVTVTSQPAFLACVGGALDDRRR